jgi:hypothetical protein
MLPNTTGTPLYDRNCDQPSSLCEQVGPDLARALGASAFIMAKTKYATQPWHTNSARIKILETNKEYVCSLETPLDLTEASFCWESMGSHYDLAKTHVHRVTRTGDQWVQVEAWLPDGQHIAASTSFKATITNPDLPTITIIAEKPTASLKKGDNGRVRITRSNTNGTLTVQGQFSGALNNGDMGWLPGSNYSASSTTWEFSDGQASLIIPIIAKQPAGDHRTKLLHITLQPSAGYNVAYPATAIIKINH